jgi:hypothetical protein
LDLNGGTYKRTVAKRSDEGEDQVVDDKAVDLVEDIEVRLTIAGFRDVAERDEKYHKEHPLGRREDRNYQLPEFPERMILPLLHSPAAAVAHVPQRNLSGGWGTRAGAATD